MIASATRPVSGLDAPPIIWANTSLGIAVIVLIVAGGGARVSSWPSSPWPES